MSIESLRMSPEPEIELPHINASYFINLETPRKTNRPTIAMDRMWDIDSIQEEVNPDGLQSATIDMNLEEQGRYYDCEFNDQFTTMFKTLEPSLSEVRAPDYVH